VGQFFGFAFPGIPYGCTYAIVAVGLVLTYQATGVFNFAFGAQAYTAAYIYFYLAVNKGLPVWLAFVLSVLVLSPLLGLIFDRFLFRLIPNNNQTAKVVTGLSLFVALGALLPIIFGSAPQYNPPSLFLNPNTVYFSVGSTPVNGLDISTMIITAVVLVGLVVLMRWTPLGLQMRASVESRRLVQLDGVNAQGVVAFAWALSSLLAGLAGVLLAPLYAQLQQNDYATLTVAAIAAAAWGVLRNLPIAALTGILIGVVEGIAQGYLPTGGILYASVLPSLPFIVLIVALMVLPGLRTLEDASDPMAGVDPPTPPITAAIRAPQLDRVITISWRVLLVAFFVSMLTWVPINWVTIFTTGITLSTIFLSITLVTGMAGQLSLCQATLSGVGAFTAAQLAQHIGLPFLVGTLVGAVFAAGVAIVLAVLSLRLKGLGLTLLTLAAALFFDNTIFPLSSVSGSGTGTGVTINNFSLGPITFTPLSARPVFVLCFVILAICAVVVMLVKKGTVGQYLAAIRGSQTAASGVGINISWNKILVFALAGAVAGIGGAMNGAVLGTIGPNNFNYEFSLVYVVVVITTGVSTIEGAIQAGMGFVIIQQLLGYLPARIGAGSLTYLLFAFGAVTYAAHPEGILEFQRRRWTLRFERLLFKNKEEELLATPSAQVDHVP
jgi:branched-chain amino acid transport system permease protein